MTGSASMQADDAPVRPIAFYLPQYHRIPENDRWWGEGFTEWTNVRRAGPLFPGHAQPKLPGALGYYDLTDPTVLDRQVALAREYGVRGFCYYFYWFNGHRLLERPLEAMLARRSPDFPFCVCWANENWTRRWDGGNGEILISQQYGFDDSLRLFDEFLGMFSDPRYIRVGGRPLLLVYRPALVPDIVATTDLWRERAIASGEREPFLVYCETSGIQQPADLGFDASLEFPPHGHIAHWLNAQITGLAPAFEGSVTSYRALIVQSLERDCSDAKRFRCVVPSWDNTARRGLTGTVFLGSSPERFGYWAEAMVRDTRTRLAGDERLMFVNAWNEWAEGCCLEPDTRFGTQYLEALQRALADGALAGGDSVEPWRERRAPARQP
ncbi:MAG: glycoside hydrolase family 99-like domain-containing protein [Betaproteobacteria bacterium]